MTRARVRSIGLFAFCFLFASQLVAASVTLEVGMDKLGGDYKNFVTGRDPEACRQACTAEGKCKSYTYVNAGVKGAQAMCFLKDIAPPATANASCTSGEKTLMVRPQ